MTVQGRKGLLQILTLYGMGTEKIEEKTGVAVSTAQECPFGLITLFVSQWNDLIVFLYLLPGSGYGSLSIQTRLSVQIAKNWVSGSFFVGGAFLPSQFEDRPEILFKEEVVVARDKGLPFCWTRQGDAVPANGPQGVYGSHHNRIIWG